MLPGASTAIVDNLGMITKIYFPRLLTVLLVVLSGLVPLLTGEAILIALTATLGPGLGPELLWLVPGTALLLVLVAGFGAVLSARHVYSRDVRYVVQALMTVGLYVTPVLDPLGDDLPAGPSQVVQHQPGVGRRVLDQQHAQRCHQRRRPRSPVQGAPSFSFSQNPAMSRMASENSSKSRGFLT